MIRPHQEHIESLKFQLERVAAANLLSKPKLVEEAVRQAVDISEKQDALIGQLLSRVEQLESQT